MKPILSLCAQPLFEARGSPIRVKAFLRALAEKGLICEVITLPVGPDRDLPPGISVRRVPNPFRVRSVAIGPSVPKLFLGILISVWGLARAIPRRFRSVHGIEEMGLPAWAIARLTGARFVFEKHSDPASYQTTSTIRRIVMASYAAVERFVCRRADIIIATGPGLAEQARSYGTKAEIRVIDDVPSGDRDADPSRSANWRKKIGAREGETVFAYIGSFADYQGVPLFLDAADRAMRTHPELRLALVGGEDQVESIRRRAVDGGYADRVFHAPSIPPEDVADFLAACDVLVSPRLIGNNTPLKVLDYLRAGKCILATDTEANRLVLDESTARLVAADEDSLAEAMISLSGSPDVRKALGIAARERFVERFGFERFSDAIGEVFGSPADRPRKNTAR